MASPSTPEGCTVLSVIPTNQPANSQIIPSNGVLGRFFNWARKKAPLLKWDDLTVNWAIYEDTRRALVGVWETLASPNVEADDVKDSVSCFLLAEANLISGLLKTDNVELTEAKKLYQKAYEMAKEWYEAANTVYRARAAVDATQRTAIQIMSCCLMVMGEAALFKSLMKVLMKVLTIFPEQVPLLLDSVALDGDVSFASVWSSLKTSVPLVSECVELCRQTACALGNAINHYEKARKLLSKINIALTSSHGAAATSASWIPPWLREGDPTVNTDTRIVQLEEWDSMVMDMLDGALFKSIRAVVSIVVFHVRGFQSLPSDWGYGDSLLSNIRRHGTVRLHGWMAKYVRDLVIGCQGYLPPPDTEHQQEICFSFYLPPVVAKAATMSRKFQLGQTAEVCTLLERLMQRVGGVESVLCGGLAGECDDYFKPVHKVLYATLAAAPYFVNNDYAKCLQILKTTSGAAAGGGDGGVSSILEAYAALYVVSSLLLDEREEAMAMRQAYLKYIVPGRWSSWPLRGTLSMMERLTDPYLTERLTGNPSYPTYHMGRLAYFKVVTSLTGFPDDGPGLLADADFRKALEAELQQYEAMLRPDDPPEDGVPAQANDKEWDLCRRMLVCCQTLKQEKEDKKKCEEEQEKHNTDQQEEEPPTAPPVHHAPHLPHQTAPPN
ncbi:unnamed protein product [Vitrella brassicaformis CCMP3155]|uniref:Uncharacterized protein n=1 Tax=Vitrella brassicaformis (strain CCMP3155) TaxID=1169540 RepID=A0A0G4EGR9_VITBC|nr:unnamed protein product [Vitrella brassicaformis CCMP3155]|eukprot:CEL94668.1 unnamed protein product [Vitrella brassicaformis CCMP3155]